MDEGLNSSERCNGGGIHQRIPDMHRAQAKGAPRTYLLSAASINY